MEIVPYFLISKLLKLRKVHKFTMYSTVPLSSSVNGRFQELSGSLDLKTRLQAMYSNAYVQKKIGCVRAIYSKIVL